MSGFGVIIEWDSTPDPARVSAIESGLAARGPDGVRMVELGECVLVHAQFATTPEALREHQPTRHISRPWWITADARIDNRTELAELLRDSAHPLDTDTDFVLAGYERWGSEVASRLRGDFAFAIWDEENRQLFMARDHFGIRPCHWTDDAPGRFVASSSLRPTLEASGAPRDCDMEYLAEYATFRLAGRGHSPFASVHRLTPASTLEVTRTGDPVHKCYWSPRPACAKMSLDEAAEAVRSHFDEAVRARSRTIGRLGVQVSGGYDSSTVFLTADAQRDGIDMVGYTFAFPGESCDESRYVNDIASMASAPIHSVIAADCPEFDHGEYVQRTWDLPLLPDSQWYVEGARRMAERGCRVVLTGQGGESVLYGNRETAALDLLVSGKVRRALEMERMSRPHPLRSLVLRSTRFLLGQRARFHPTGVVGRKLKVRATRNATRSADAHLLTQRLVAARPLVFEPVPQAEGPWRWSAGTRAAWFAGRDSLTFFTEQWDAIAVEGGIECRHPFLDVDLVEFVLTVGEDLLLTKNSPRGLHIFAFGDRLPPSVRFRQNKARFDRPAATALLTMSTNTCLERDGAGLVEVGDLQLRIEETTKWLRLTTENDMPGAFWDLCGAISLCVWGELGRDERRHDHE